jgi:hypothetical protein
MTPRRTLSAASTLGIIGIIGVTACSPDSSGDGFTTMLTLNPTDETGVGDGDGDPGDGDPGDGDGDGDPGDGDPGDGDGDDEPAEPSCDDGIQNQDETDVDCGGVCAKCAEGSMCIQATDCETNMCIGNTCVSGCLGDIECAHLDEPCLKGFCNIGACIQYPVNDNLSCATGEVCRTGGTCNAGECVEQDVDCSEFDSGCTAGVCDLDTGECMGAIVNEGLPCYDIAGCFESATCSEGVCANPVGGPLFYEEFANNDAGWELGPNWEIGSAVAGCGDPGIDHSPSANNGVAGVVLGGCAPTGAIHPYYCLTSPIIDTSGMPSVWMTYYRDLWSDYTPFMKNTLEVYNGASWVMLFETLGPPEVNDSEWIYFAYNVSAYANPDMRFRWCYDIQSLGVFQRGSWNVDDVTVALSECNGGD